MKRVFLIVLDSVGVGAAPDAARFGDAGSNTLGTCRKTGKLKVPNLEKLGLFSLDGMESQKEERAAEGCFARMTEKSNGKDTTTGHWEIAGLISEKPMPVYPHGFPDGIIKAFEEQTHRGTLCNLPYSGTEVIKVYGQEHIRTGKLIVYTSADSVFQIAAHEEVVPLKELYEDCRIARKLLTGEHAVGRVIARPFVGSYPDFTRTVNRHDFSLLPPQETVLDEIQKAGMETIGVGKIYDIFAGKGISRTFANEGNDKNMERVFALQKEDFTGLCFVNLVDFDMIYGHRNNIEGYTAALNAFDVQLGRFLAQMHQEDLLLITADHGCDPGYPGTDHTREYTPCLCYGKTLKKGVDLHTRESFADIAATVAEALGISHTGAGKSFYQEIR
jgi:phosphopentomutase